jgi:hypothetical protein
MSLRASLAQEIPDAFAACAAIDADSVRLACFDKETARQLLNTRSSTAEVALAPAVEADVADVGKQKPPTTVSSQSTAAEEAAPAPLAIPSAVNGDSASDAANATVEANVGGIVETEDPSTRKEFEEISAVVTKIRAQARGEHVVYLDNGQIWQENVKTSHFPVDPGTTVTIRKRRFGGYLLFNEAGNSFPMKRIR